MRGFSQDLLNLRGPPQNPLWHEFPKELGLCRAMPVEPRLPVPPGPFDLISMPSPHRIYTHSHKNSERWATGPLQAPSQHPESTSRRRKRGPKLSGTIPEIRPQNDRTCTDSGELRPPPGRPSGWPHPQSDPSLGTPPIRPQLGHRKCAHQPGHGPGWPVGFENGPGPVHEHIRAPPPRDGRHSNMHTGMFVDRNTSTELQTLK